MQTRAGAITVIAVLDMRPTHLKLLLNTESCDESSSPE
jgi:hypothetical protein